MTVLRQDSAVRAGRVRPMIAPAGRTDRPAGLALEVLLVAGAEPDVVFFTPLMPLILPSALSERELCCTGVNLIQRR